MTSASLSIRSTQVSPIHIGPDFFAAHLSAGSSLDVRAVVGRDTPSGDPVIQCLGDNIDLAGQCRLRTEYPDGSIECFHASHNKHMGNAVSTNGVCFDKHLLQDQPMNLGKRIEARLKELEWERSRLLGAVYGLTPQALSNLIVRDSRRSEWDVEIAKALGVSVSWLVYGEEIGGSKNAAEPLADQYTADSLSADERSIIAGYRASSAERKKIMLDIAATALAEQSTVKAPPAATSKAKQRSHRVADKTGELLAEVGLVDPTKLYKAQK